MAYTLLKIQMKKKVSLLAKINLNYKVDIIMNKKDYPQEIEYDDWLKRQNYFLTEQNKNLKKKLAEADEYINYLLDKLELLNK